MCDYNACYCYRMLGCNRNLDVSSQCVCPSVLDTLTTRPIFSLAAARELLHPLSLLLSLLTTLAYNRW